ncbi:MAG TPA: sigma 54-interacting transcriptional regulator, partial [Polyangiaceae bacterium]
LSIQAKLLRVLEERSVLRVGATKPRPIDVRFVWATNRDLRVEVQAGRFRNDLYYRIAGVEFSIPPLRRRPLEIEPLARLFLRRFCERSGLPIPELTAEALRALHAYQWPGNVRELKNVMERAPFLCENGTITAAQIPQQPLNDLDVDEFPAEDQDRTQVFAPLRTPRFDDERPLAEPPSSAPRSEPSLPAIDSEEERQRVLRALEQCGGNQTRAAKLLGVSRRTLINRVERLNLPRPKKT